MTTEIKAYSEQQMDKLAQFKRVNTVLSQIDARKDALEKGQWVVVSEDNNGLAIDKTMANAIVGASVGIFQEGLDMGLKEEMIDIVDFGKKE